MKDIQNYPAKKYADSRFRPVEEGIYQTEDSGKIIYCTSLSFVQEPEQGEGESAKNISEYPLMDVLDIFPCYISDRYPELNTEQSQTCYLEFSSTQLEDVQNLRTIIGTHIENDHDVLWGACSERSCKAPPETSPILSFDDIQDYLSRLRSADGKPFGWAKDYSYAENSSNGNYYKEFLGSYYSRYFLYLNGEPAGLMLFDLQDGSLPPPAKGMVLADAPGEGLLCGDLENKALHAGLSLNQYIVAAKRTIKLQREASKVRTIYPNFDLQAAQRDPYFSQLLNSGMDMKTAYEQARMRRAATPQKQTLRDKLRSFHLPPRLSNALWSILGPIISLLVLILIFCFLSWIFDDKPDNKVSGPDPVPSSTAASTVETKPQPVPFSQKVLVGKQVYVDIVSIKTRYHIYQEEESTGLYDRVVCECTTPDGSSVWTVISVFDYYKIFEIPAMTLEPTYQERQFPHHVRLYGKCTYVELESEGLSEEIGVKKLIAYESSDFG